MECELLSRDAIATWAATSSAPLDDRVASIASRQCGVVGIHQLQALGLSRGAVRVRVNGGRLHRVHRGVYAVGHRSSPWQARYVAALLVAGPGVALSYSSAAAWWGLRPRSGGSVHVTVPRAHGRAQHAGVVMHRRVYVPNDETTTHDGLPITSVARTLLDLAGTVRRHELDRAVEVAVRRGLLSSDVTVLLSRYPTRPGTRLLAGLVAEHGDHGRWTQSDAEAMLVDVCRAGSIPLPQTNVRVCGDVVDAWWPRECVVAEIDGLSYHGTRSAAQRDRTKDARRMAAGIITVRFTVPQLQAGGADVLAALRGAMRRAAS